MPVLHADRARDPAGAGTARRSAPTAADRSPRAQVLQLQAVAGNAAVAALLGGEPTRHPVQRLVQAGATAPPVPPAPPDPKKHPGLSAAVKSTRRATASAARHPSTASKVAAAAKAAAPPAGDRDAQAKAAKAGEMTAAPAPGFDKAAFVAAVKAAIDKQSPKSLEEADEFGRSGKSDAIAADVRGRVAQGKDGAAKPMAEASAKPPDASKAVEKPVEPLPPDPAVATPRIDAGQAAPSRAPPEQLDLRHGPAETNAQMADAGVTDQQLRNSNEPEFAGALAAKQDAEQHAQTAPAAVREQEAQVLGAARQDATAAGAGAATAMLGARRAGLARVTGGQQGAQSKDEQERAKVTARVTAIFDETKAAVDAILTGIDPQVNTAFTTGEAAAKRAFTDQHTREMREFRDRRYSGVGGGLRWTADLLLGPEPEVNEIFARARRSYEAGMTKVINDVADLVGRELTRAKDRVAKGRADLDAYVRGLSPALRKVGADAAKDVGSRFESLEESVDEKGQALAEDLATKYVEARTAVDDEITKMQEEHKGLVDKAKDAVGGAIKTILKLKDMLLGVLARAMGAVEKIIKDPIAFLGNLVNAVKGGIVAFGSNILTHLKAGLQTWLFGALSAAGIELPEKFDLQGVLKLVLSLLGLTWANVRARIAAKLPPGTIEMVEQGFDVVKLILKEGLGGLWRMVVEKVGDIKEMILGQVREMVSVEIIKAGIVWLISMLNPASAFVKACKMIYDVVMFFVEKADQIKAFVDSILDSVESIASGGVGAVAGYIEKTLGKMVPVLIGFLASLLGLGGISGKIRKIIEAVQKPVNQVIDWVVGKAIAFGKKALALGKKALAKIKAKGKEAWGKFKKKLGIKEKTPEEKLDKGMKVGVGVLNKFAGKRIGDRIARPMLSVLKYPYGLSLLEPVVVGDRWAVHAEVQRAISPPSNALVGSGGIDAKTIDQMRTWIKSNRPANVPKLWIGSDEAEKVLKAGDADRVYEILKKAKAVRKGGRPDPGTGDSRINAYGDRKSGDPDDWHHVGQQSGYSAAIIGYNKFHAPTMKLPHDEHVKTFKPQEGQRNAPGYLASLGTAANSEQNYNIAVTAMAGRGDPASAEYAAKATLAEQNYLFSLTPLSGVGSAIDQHEAEETALRGFAASVFAQSRTLLSAAAAQPATP
ncbi:hypothetical protein ACGGZK_01275 [Agromyces sp. MMS24-K17]|uniref:phage tail protein n=1 Tax=Agromyces sp. MMS24-K17 TaxID=3372850 RepID=UPI0037550577